MFVQRLRGLITLHVAATTAVALLLFLVYATFVPYLKFMQQLSEDLNLAPYLLCINFGMLAAGRHVQRLANSFHRLSWASAAWLSTRQVTTVALLVFAFMFAFKDRGMSRLFMGSYFGVLWITLTLTNQGLPKMLSRVLFADSRKVPTLFLGTLRNLGKLKHWLASKEVLGLQAMGFLTLESDLAAKTEPPFLGGLPDLAQCIQEKGAVQVIMLEIPRSTEEGRFIIETCQNQGARLLIYSNLAEQFRHPLITVTEEGHQFYTLQEEPLEDPLNRVIKRALDVTLALPVVLFALPPLIVVVWLMQRLQAPGPVFHIQERTGYGHHRFRILKFRSMYVSQPGVSTENEQARKGDARIYPFGRFLRRSSLDEFPQFWNVLVGQMSAVGPRPHLVAHDDLFATQLAAYRTRFFVKPGITGLAQCNGYRGEITDPSLLEKRIEYDLNYIANWSIWLDLQIVGKTVKQVIVPPKSAY